MLTIWQWWTSRSIRAAASLGVAFRFAILSPPGEHLVGVDVVTPRHHRHRNPRLTALRDNLALLMPNLREVAGESHRK